MVSTENTENLQIYVKMYWLRFCLEFISHLAFCVPVLKPFYVAYLYNSVINFLFMWVYMEETLFYCVQKMCSAASIWKPQKKW